MALGAVLLSVPMAMALSLYGWLASDLAIGQSLALYPVFGTVFLMTFTLVQGLRADDFD